MRKVKYPFSPELLDALPEELAELFRALEDTLLDEVCSRLKIADQLNEVTVQDIRALRSHGIDLKKIKRAIQKTADVSEEKLNKLLDDVVERNRRYYNDLITLADVTKPGRLVDTSDIDAIRRQTLGEFRNLTQSLGFLVDNGQRMLPPAQAYQWALNSSTLQIQSGAISYNQAIANAVKQLAESEGSQVLPICAKLEADIAELDDPDEKAMFMEELGLSESGLDRLIQCSYSLLGLISFLTAGSDECRAWTIKNGTKAPQAAGKIHSDFERGFIRAEVIAFEDLKACGTLANAKAKGLLRSEGKEYVMHDGDVVNFLFNV